MKIETISTVNSLCGHSTNNGRKIAFADDIISVFMPLFSDEIDRKKRIYENAKRDRQHLKKNIVEGKQTLKRISITLKKERLVREILVKINDMVTSDVLYGNIKQDVINLLNNMETLDSDDLASELVKLNKLVSKEK